MNAALAIIQSPDYERILMCRRRTEDETFSGWCFPGGKLKPGESHDAGLLRELKEELGPGFDRSNVTTGWFLSPVTEVATYSPKKDQEYTIKVFWMHLKEIPPNIALSSEYEEYAWVTPSEAQKLPLAGNATRAILGFTYSGKMRVWPIQNREPMFPDEPGMFGTQRKHDVHTGIDLYCERGDRICAVESGRVIGIEVFTGPNTTPPSPWWNETFAILVEGYSGVLVYGEVNPRVKIGDDVLAGQTIATVDVSVLKTYKGRPMTMLHFEHMLDGKSTLWWELGQTKPACLLDPTRILQDSLAETEPKRFNLDGYDGIKFR